MTESNLLHPDSAALAQACVDICEAHKAQDVVLVDVSGSSVLADYYLICSALSEPQIRAISGALHKNLSDAAPCRRTEGTPGSRWMLLDFGLVLVHVLHPEKREYYRLEELWNEGKVIYRSEPDKAPPAPAPEQRTDATTEPDAGTEPTSFPAETWSDNP